MPFISSVAGKTSSLSSIRKRNYPQVSGGTLTSDGTHYYRIFTASGDLKVDYLPLNNVKLLIVGGGSGGRWGSSGSASWLSASGAKSVMAGIGGGSGGQVLTPAAISVPAGTSVVTVGGGGGNNAKGSNSSFQPSGQSAITALGGENYEHASYTNAYSGNYNSVTGQTFDTRNGYDLWQGFPFPPHKGGDGYAHVLGSAYGGFFPYLPYFMNGGGGAGGQNVDYTSNNIGTGGPGENANEYSGGAGRGGFDAVGIGEFLIPSLGHYGIYGCGAGGSGGGYLGGYSYWGDNYETTSRVAGYSGPGAGWSSSGFYDSPTSGAANRGGGGGSGQTGFGNGGSGIIIVKYPKSEVGE